MLPTGNKLQETSLFSMAKIQRYGNQNCIKSSDHTGERSHGRPLKHSMEQSPKPLCSLTQRQIVLYLNQILKPIFSRTLWFKNCMPNPLLDFLRTESVTISSVNLIYSMSPIHQIYFSLSIKYKKLSKIT